MKFSGKMCLKIILKFTKNYGFTLYLEDTLFKKPHGRVQIDPPSRRFRVNANNNFHKNFFFRVLLLNEIISIKTLGIVKVIPCSALLY